MINKKGFFTAALFLCCSLGFSQSYEYTTSVQETSSGTYDVSTCTSTQGSSCSTPGASFRQPAKTSLQEYMSDIADWFGSLT